MEKVLRVPERVALTIYQEHERPDRSGYPNRRPGPLVHDFAKIISICDAYEAMTTPRGWRSSRAPYAALEFMVPLAAKRQYDPVLFRALLQTIGLFPVGSWVRLSSGEYAKVIGNNVSRYDRPVVRTLFDAAGKPEANPELLDLSSSGNRKIVTAVPGERFAADPASGF
jgi:HD-GYP domain-containing protein (c-di-GMP phosphodiesterase class II)